MPFLNKVKLVLKILLTLYDDLNPILDRLSIGLYEEHLPRIDLRLMEKQGCLNRNNPPVSLR